MTWTRACSVSRVVGMIAATSLLASSGGYAQVLRAQEMTTAQYGALDRNKTVVLLSLGILEEHGPYLPAYTDGYISERLVEDVAAAVVEKGWNVLVFPTLPLGSGGANELAAKYPFPGTFAVRTSTLRTVLMDLSDELAEAGFRWLFIANNHGAPNHNQALDQVCEYFGEVHGGHMVVLRGIPLSATANTDRELQDMLSEKARNEDAGSGHAGIGETSLMLFLQPKLVENGYRDAPPQTAPGFMDMITVAKGEKWTGYFGSPRFGTAAYGAKSYKSLSAEAVAQALQTLDGIAPKAPSYGDMAGPHNSAALKRDEDIANRQKEWLRKKGIESK